MSAQTESAAPPQPAPAPPAAVAAQTPASPPFKYCFLHFKHYFLLAMPLYSILNWGLYLYTHLSTVKAYS